MSRRTSNTHPSKRHGSNSKVIEVSKGFATVKIYTVKNRGKTMFTLSYFVAGRRRCKMFVDEAETRKEAASTAEKLNLGQQQALQLTGADRDSYVAARVKLAPLGVPRYDAVTDYAAAVGLLGDQSLLGAVHQYRHAQRNQHTPFSNGFGGFEKLHGFDWIYGWKGTHSDASSNDSKINDEDICFDIGEPIRNG